MAGLGSLRFVNPQRGGQWKHESVTASGAMPLAERAERYRPLTTRAIKLGVWIVAGATILDAWGVDVAVTASQKGLMMIPGLAFVAASPKAKAVHQSAGKSLRGR